MRKRGRAKARKRERTKTRKGEEEKKKLYAVLLYGQMVDSFELVSGLAEKLCAVQFPIEIPTVAYQFTPVVNRKLMAAFFRPFLSSYSDTLAYRFTFGVANLFN